MENNIQRIAVLTSGGDAPGMNAAVRAVTRTAASKNLRIFGVLRGFYGLLYRDIIELSVNGVGDIIHRGGTILRTSRVKEFRDQKMRGEAIRTLEAFGIEGLVIIGGNGSLCGGRELARLGVKVAGIPASIDNDVFGTDLSIGFDTAVNTVLEAINRIRDTATSHERIFIIEVMGRESGQIALAAGLAGGAESILVPELPFDIHEIVDRINQGIARGKLHSIIVVAEGCCSGLSLGKEIERLSRHETRVTVLGHTQRGGTPTAIDRNLASRMGARAVEWLTEGRHHLMVGLQAGHLVPVSLEDVVKGTKELDLEQVELARILAR
ncbi:MAG: 6-phosphofructokinase [Solirubrobacterales bacterium]